MHVERFESALWQTSSLLLVAAGEAVAIDPGISRQEVEALAARAEELGAPVTHVLATHADWDHVCGMAVFPDAVAAMGPSHRASGRGGGPAELIVRRALEHDLEIVGSPRVDRTLAPGVAHRVGPFTVETIALAGHTPDGLGFRIRSLDVLAVGDHLSAVEFPFVSDTAAYRFTLAGLIDVLRHDPPAQVVPGHGPAAQRRRGSRDRRGRPRLPRALRDAVAARWHQARTASGRSRPAWRPSRRARRRSPACTPANVEAQLDEAAGRLTSVGSRAVEVRKVG